MSQPNQVSQPNTPSPQTVAAVTLYAVGGVLAALGCALLVTVHANAATAAHGGRDFQGLFIPGLFLILTGAGLLLCSRIAFALLVLDVVSLIGRLLALFLTQPEHRPGEALYLITVTAIALVPLWLVWRARAALRRW